MSLPRRWMIVAPALVLAMVAAGCADRGTPDLVVVTMDTLRADRLGCYGNPDGLTPNLDALASESVIFGDVTAPTPLTLPSHASLFTGRYPTSTGVRNNGTFRVPESETTLAELLAEAGWRTGAVVAAYPLHARYGLAQGFEIYDDDFPSLEEHASGAAPVFYPERDAQAVTDRAIEVWRRLEGGRRFLWVHYFDPHAPYAPPLPWASDHAETPYDGEVAYLDAEFGRLLEALEGNGRRPVILVASDHGEALGEHGEMTHGVFLYQSTLRVPMLLRADNLPKGERILQPASLVDVVPTLLSLLAVPFENRTDGADLLSLTEDGPEPDRPVYAESFLARYNWRFSELRSLRKGGLKYIDAPAPELYDLHRDPNEENDLARSSVETQALAARLDSIVAGEDPDAPARAGDHLDPQAAANLRALGYITGGGESHSATDGTRGRDPKDRIDYMNRYDRALGLVSDGRYDEGIAILRELAPLAPENYLLALHVGTALLAAGRPAEAEEALLGVISAAPEMTQALLVLAVAQGSQGKIDAARKSYVAAVASAPWSAEPHIDFGRFLEGEGLFEDAAREYLAAIDLEPSETGPAYALLNLRVSRGDVSRAESDLAELALKHPEATGVLVAYARALVLQGSIEPAEPVLRRARASNPLSKDASLALGNLLLDTNRPAEALDCFQEILSAHESSAGLQFGVGRALAALGRRQEAESAFARALQLEPRYAAVYTFRGKLLEGDGSLAAAAEMYRRALALDRSDREAYLGLQRISGRR